MEDDLLVPQIETPEPETENIIGTEQKEFFHEVLRPPKWEKVIYLPFLQYILKHLFIYKHLPRFFGVVQMINVLENYQKL